MSGQERVTNFFDSNVEDYEAKHYRGQVHSFMTVRQRRVLELVDALGLPEGTPALDAGCGPGYLLEALGRGGSACRAWTLPWACSMRRAPDSSKPGPRTPSH